MYASKCDHEHTAYTSYACIPPQQNHSKRCLELATVSNHNTLRGLARGRADGLDRPDNFHALGHTSEDDVLAVEPVGLCGRAGDHKGRDGVCEPLKSGGKEPPLTARHNEVVKMEACGQHQEK